MNHPALQSGIAVMRFVHHFIVALLVSAVVLFIAIALFELIWRVERKDCIRSCPARLHRHHDAPLPHLDAVYTVV